MRKKIIATFLFSLTTLVAFADLPPDPVDANNEGGKQEITAKINEEQKQNTETNNGSHSEQLQKEQPKEQPQNKQQKQQNEKNSNTESEKQILDDKTKQTANTANNETKKKVENSKLETQAEKQSLAEKQTETSKEKPKEISKEASKTTLSKETKTTEIKTEIKKEERNDKNSLDEKKIETKKDDKNEQGSSIANFFDIKKSDNKQRQEKKAEQNIEIEGKYDNNKDVKVIVIKDGVKNINISFKPEIKVGECGGNCKKVVLDNKNAKNNADKNVKKQIRKKQNTNKTKLQKQKKTNVSAKKNKNNKNNKNDKIDNSQAQIKPIKIADGDAKNGKKLKTIRRIYEDTQKKNAKFNCIDGECGNNRYDNGERNVSSQIEKNMIRRSKKQAQENTLYIVNNIISVDEDTMLTEQTIEKIIQESNGEIKRARVNDNDKFRNAYLGGLETAFVNQYNIVEGDNLKYGEVAFINDYND